jgi:hypothetical protein
VALHLVPRFNKDPESPTIPRFETVPSVRKIANLALTPIRHYRFAPIGKVSALAYLASKVRLNAAAASALSITIKSLSCRLRPDADEAAAA